MQTRKVARDPYQVARWVRLGRGRFGGSCASPTFVRVSKAFAIQQPELEQQPRPPLKRAPGLKSVTAKGAHAGIPFILSSVHDPHLAGCAVLDEFSCTSRPAQRVTSADARAVVAF